MGGHGKQIEAKLLTAADLQPEEEGERGQLIRDALRDHGRRTVTVARYRIDETDGSLSETPETSLSGEGKREREDLQRWLGDYPDVLESGLFVLAEEYGEWTDSGRRIDLLALDRDGRLVVIELKRDEGAFMDLQALRYAALVAHMTFEQAVTAHERWLRARAIDGDARERILDHLSAVGGAEPEIESARPRILLAARDFPRELTTSVLWLRDQGIDIRCTLLLPYRVEGTLVLDVTQMIPLPEADDYMVRIRDKAIEAETRKHPVVEWTAGDVERLAGLQLSWCFLAMMDRIAEEPDSWIPFATIVEQVDHSSGQIREALAALTRTVRGDFGRDNWPFEYQARPNKHDRSRRAHYLMTPVVAGWWTAVRGDRTQR